MSLKEECAYSLELLIHGFLFFSLCELSDSSCDGCITEILDLPQCVSDSTGLRGGVVGQHIEQVLLATHESLPEVHLARRELPVLSVPIAHDHVRTVLCRIMDGLEVLNSGVDIPEILGGSCVFNGWVAVWDLVGRVVVQVHLAAVRVVSQYILIELGYFLELIRELLGIAVVLIHNVVLVLEELDIAVSHCQEDGRSLNHKPHIDAHEVPREHVERGRVQIELVHHPVLDCFQLIRQFIHRFVRILGLTRIVQAHFCEKRTLFFF